MKEKLQVENDSHLIILSKKQSQGQGQHGRQWLSLDQGVQYLSSLTLLSPLPTAYLPMSNILLSLLWVDLFKQLYDLEIKIKWPNDLYFNGKKCGGILSELWDIHTRQLLVGIGINLWGETPKSLPDATSIFSNHETLPDLITLTRQFLLKWEVCTFDQKKDLNGWIRRGFLQHCAFTDCLYTPINSNQNIPAQIFDIEDTGALVIGLTKEKKTISTHSGQIRKNPHKL
ncbi:MAG: biotin--[acetyl-CoA-carboxylase] ligase [Bdellovibrionales bacterium]|nr:biotin--[acetyl-CoA-carboxylase] ligase [Bdellovibrionales bacterium]